MKTTIAVLAVSLIAGAASAQAADFSGFYLGADIGGGTLAYDVPNSDLSGSDGGLTYGGFGGYRMALGNNWLVGVEGRYGETDADIFANGITLSSGRQLSLSGLVGYQVADKWLLFGTLGYDGLRVRASDGVTSRRDTVDGMGLSLGVEYALTTNISLRAAIAGSSHQLTGFSGNTFDNPSFGSTSIGAIFRY